MPRPGTKVGKGNSKPLLDRRRKWKKMILSAQTACLSCGPRPLTTLETPTCKAKNSRLLRPTMAAGLLSLVQALRTIASSHGSRKGSVRNSGQINRISSTWHFAVANYRCFYTLRATWAVSGRSSALDILWNRPSAVLVCLAATRSWRGALTCNRIHRTGG